MSFPTIRSGIYRHFKGNMYQVIGVAQRVDSPEVYVVYRPLYGDQELVVRGYEEFSGRVVRDGREFQRFEFVGSAPGDESDCQCVEQSPQGFVRK